MENNEFEEKVFDLAQELKVGFQEAAEAAQEFAKQGLTLSETLEWTKGALILSRITGFGNSAKNLVGIRETFQKLD